MVMIGIVPKRYSFELIKETNDFSINIPTIDLFKAVKVCGSKSGRNTDKFDVTGLSPRKAEKISSYIIEECPVSLECKIVHTIDLKGTHVWFIGEVVLSHIRKNYKRSQALLYWPQEYRFVGNTVE